MDKFEKLNTTEIIMFIRSKHGRMRGTLVDGKIEVDLQESIRYLMAFQDYIINK